MTPPFRLLPHTSEMVLEIQAPDWASFYRAAAEGLLAAYGLRPGKSGTKKARRAFAGETPEDVLVAWLNELIYLIGTKRTLPAGFKVLEASPEGLTAVVRGATVRSLSLEREVKAATYHGLKVEENRSGIRARVILDV